MFRIFVFFTCCALNLMQVSSLPNPAETANKCLSENSLKVEDVQKLLMEKPEKITENVSNFTKCMMKQSGLISDDGSLIHGKIDEIASQIPGDGEKLKNCLKGIEKVASSQDVNKIKGCLPSIPGLPNIASLLKQ